MIFNGAKAKIYIKYDGTIEEISSLISNGMMLPDFYFKTDMDPPHNITGQCEALGFSIWVTPFYDEGGFDYILEIETNAIIEDSSLDLVCDISPWLARYVSVICEIYTSIKV